MIFSLKLWLAVFIFIDLFSAWWYAKGRDICKVVIKCLLNGMPELLTLSQPVPNRFFWNRNAICENIFAA